ncbi:MAG: hypothetical protein AB1483_09815 [Candidatus Zixiibacteriota bacterium]
MLFKSHKKFASPLIAVALFVLMFAAANTQAQEVATGGANATVLAVLAVTSVQDLNFGSVLQGVPTSADIDVVAEAADFQVAGAGGSEVALYFQLPEYLWNSTNTDRMIISFGATDCEIDPFLAGDAATKSGSETVEDPYNLTATTLGADNGLHVYLVGTVYPAVDQAVGAYSGDIVLTAAYTGN